MKPMETIPIEIVERVWSELQDMELEDAEPMLETIAQRQPYLISYLMARGEGFLHEDEIADLVFLGAIAVRSFEQAGGGSHQKVTAELLDELDKATFQKMDDLAKEPRESEAGVEEIAVEMAMGTTQQPLLQTILGFLMEGGSEIDPERQGIAFFLLKIAVDALDQS